MQVWQIIIDHINLCKTTTIWPGVRADTERNINNNIFTNTDTQYKHIS